MGKRRSKEEMAADRALIAAIRESIETNPKAVVRALILIGADQTPDEVASHAALQHNGKGWTRVDANYGQFLREVAIREGRLYGKLLKDGRRIALKYVNTQLFEHAKRKRGVTTHG